MTSTKLDNIKNMEDVKKMWKSGEFKNIVPPSFGGNKERDRLDEKFVVWKAHNEEEYKKMLKKHVVPAAIKTFKPQSELEKSFIIARILAAKNPWEGRKTWEKLGLHKSQTKKRIKRRKRRRSKSSRKKKSKKK